MGLRRVLARQYDRLGGSGLRPRLEDVRFV